MVKYIDHIIAALIIVVCLILKLWKVDGSVDNILTLIVAWLIGKSFMPNLPKGSG